MRYLFVLLSLITFLSGSAAIKVTRVSVPDYGTCNMIVYVPDNATASKLPVVVFIPGIGESNSDPDNLYMYGPLGFVKNGWKPDFVIAGIQPLKGFPPASWTHTMLKALLADPAYKVDKNKIYLTGISSGAFGIYTYILEQQDLITPAAAVLLSYGITASCGNYDNGTDQLCGNDLRWKNIPSWAFCGVEDPFYNKMKRYFGLFAQAHFNTRFTAYPGGHSGWANYFDPNYKENGKNIYDWLLQYQLNASTPSPLKFKSIKLTKKS